jgi:hypothetical protein
LPIRLQEARSPSEGVDRPVTIDEDCWIGINAVIMPGVRVGRGAIVGANTVVTKDVHPYSIVVGCPARPIKPRLAWRPPNALDATKTSAIPYLYEGFAFEPTDDALVARLAAHGLIAVGGGGPGELALEIEAKGSGTLIVQGQPCQFAERRSVLKVGLGAESGLAWAGARLISLALVNNSPVRLISVQWVAQNSP